MNTKKWDVKMGSKAVDPMCCGRCLPQYFWHGRLYLVCKSLQGATHTNIQVKQVYNSRYSSAYL